jgi:hypothetical protein
MRIYIHATINTEYDTIAKKQETTTALLNSMLVNLLPHSLSYSCSLLLVASSFFRRRPITFSFLPSLALKQKKITLILTKS